MEDLKLKLRQLLDQREWTAEEKSWLLEYVEKTGAPELRELLEEKYNHSPEESLAPFLSRQLLDNIHEKIISRSAPARASLIRIRFLGAAAAACLIGLLILGAWWQLSEKKDRIAQGRPRKTEQANSKEIPPGGNKATLTLANGSTIILGDVKNGALALQGRTRVIKLDGKLSYESEEKGAAQMMYNTIATPRGGQYEVVLPDGSEVWLDAASSLRFPTAFTGKERRVEITGEAYFEIKPDSKKPFFVTVGKSEVQVLGTHFNIMAYEEEASVKTTLLEGSVRFTNGTNSSVLIPGQQSQLNKNGLLRVEDTFDAVEVIAWKNGLFHFENADINTVMRQLSRWYDVDVSYKDPREGNLYFADIPRTTNLSDALKALSLTGKVHFEVQGKKIIVEE